MSSSKSMRVGLLTEPFLQEWQVRAIEQLQAETGVDVTILHMRVAPGRTLELPLPLHFNALVYVMSGSGACGEESRRIDEGKAARFDSGGERAVVHCSPGGEALEAMLMAGRPLREPIARGGPFVMSTREEILQAFEDHRLGSLGRGRSG